MNKQGSHFFYRVKAQKLKPHPIFLAFLFARGFQKETQGVYCRLGARTESLNLALSLFRKRQIQV